MSQFFLDVSVNMYEVIATFALMLSLFRFSIKGYVSLMIIAAAVMAQSSYLLRFIFHQDSITPIIMLLWFVVFFWRLFRIHPFYALLMTVTGYLGYLVIQSALLYLLQIPFTLDEIVGSLLHIKLVQVTSSTVTLLIAYWLLERRIGFSFVPDRLDEKVEMRGLNLLLLLVSIVACFFISGVAYIFINVNFLYSTLVTVFFLTILIILNFAFKKEMKS
ncbi:hypothetical protein [Cohnella silvisoli]|uniref:Uncharacterized protein n=1 Tax=Cohnella silvisoli TaxID=2873699 RepID=A0ABV1KW18_9BACL|nr:hypothetical protein [Cohnella silvisoli]MCD9023692.1 hypothetical protein [Cohnella silvisoli]